MIGSDGHSTKRKLSSDYAEDNRLPLGTMITSVVRKQKKARDNLRKFAILKATFQWVDEELRRRQSQRKRKWSEIREELCTKRLCVTNRREEIDTCLTMTEVIDDDPFGLDNFFSKLKTVNVPGKIHVY